MIIEGTPLETVAGDPILLTITAEGYVDGTTLYYRIVGLDEDDLLGGLEGEFVIEDEESEIVIPTVPVEGKSDRDFIVEVREAPEDEEPVFSSDEGDLSLKSLELRLVDPMTYRDVLEYGVDNIRYYRSSENTYESVEIIYPWTNNQLEIGSAAQVPPVLEYTFREMGPWDFEINNTNWQLTNTQFQTQIQYGINFIRSLTGIKMVMPNSGVRNLIEPGFITDPFHARNFKFVPKKEDNGTFVYSYQGGYIHQSWYVNYVDGDDTPPLQYEELSFDFGHCREGFSCYGAVNSPGSPPGKIAEFDPQPFPRKYGFALNRYNSYYVESCVVRGLGSYSSIIVEPNSGDGIPGADQLEWGWNYRYFGPQYLKEEEYSLFYEHQFLPTFELSNNVIVPGETITVTLSTGEIHNNMTFFAEIVGNMTEGDITTGNLYELNVVDREASFDITFNDEILGLEDKSFRIYFRIAAPHGLRFKRSNEIKSTPPEIITTLYPVNYGDCVSYAYMARNAPDGKVYYYNQQAEIFEEEDADPSIIGSFTINDEIGFFLIKLLVIEDGYPRVLKSDSEIKFNLSNLEGEIEWEIVGNVQADDFVSPMSGTIDLDSESTLTLKTSTLKSLGKYFTVIFRKNGYTLTQTELINLKATLITTSPAKPSWGQRITFNIETEHTPDGEFVDYDLRGYLQPSDLTEGSLRGQVEINNNQGSFQIRLRNVE